MRYSPSVNVRFWAQPAISARCSSPSARSAGLSPSRSSIVRMTERRNLLGDVDRHGAPGDAPPAADAPRLAELVDPGAQLVREPLAIAAPARAADAAAV